MIFIDPTGYSVENSYGNGEPTESGYPESVDNEGTRSWIDDDGVVHVVATKDDNNYADITGDNSPAYENFHGHDNEPAGGAEYYAAAKDIPGSRRMVFYPGNEIFTNLPRGGGLAGYGGAPRNVPRVKNGPKFPGLKDHAARHSNLELNAYYNKAVENLRVGRKFKVRHDGQTKNAYVTRIGRDRFTFTSTSRNGKTIFTHMDVDAQYLRNKGITLPEGF